MVQKAEEQMGQLHRDHDEIRAAMARFASLLTRGHDATREDMPRERLAFSQLLQRHRAVEEAEMNAALPGAPLVAALNADMQAILREYSAHIGRWVPARIPAHWDDYCAATLALQRRLRHRLAWEERELFPRLPAARTGLIAPPPPSSNDPSSPAPRDTIAASWRA